MTDASATAVRDARLAWIIGGSLFIGYGVLLLALGAMTGAAVPGSGAIASAVWAGGFLVFAFGVRRSGSVVDRQPVGVAAMVVAGVLPVLSTVLWWILPAPAIDSAVLIMIGQGLAVLMLASLLVATITIGRSAALPQRVRWLPLIAFAVVSAAQILGQFVPSATSLPAEAMIGLYFGSVLLTPLALLLLGILAIVLAPREAPAAPVDRTVPVYGPPPAD
ncbi:hypothetical protein [Microbacterium sp. HJ5]